MTVIELIENEDGSATVTLDITDKEKTLLLQVGFTQVMRDSIAAEEANLLLPAEQ